jgi:hypothetical protein
MVTVLHEGPPIITDRQRQVIELIAAGCREVVLTAAPQTIPAGLGLSNVTVDTRD